jgi:hypothetical protein
LFSEITRHGPIGRMTPRSFGRQLKNLQSNLRPHFTMEFGPGPHNTTLIKITPSAKSIALHAKQFGQQPEPVKLVKEVKTSSEINK